MSHSNVHADAADSRDAGVRCVEFHSLVVVFRPGNKITALYIQEDFSGGVRSGVNGTPTFFVNGVRHDSPYEVRDLPSAIHQATLAAAA